MDKNKTDRQEKTTVGHEQRWVEIGSPNSSKKHRTWTIRQPADRLQSGDSGVQICGSPVGETGTRVLRCLVPCRYMRTCQDCPEFYPWTGRTGIANSLVDPL